MNVLHIRYGKVFGGLETFLIALAKDRDFCKDMQPSFVILGEDTRLANELTATGAKTDVFGKIRMSQPWTVLAAWWQLSQILQRDHIDVVFFHAIWETLIFGAIVKLHKLPLVFFQHANPYSDIHWTEQLARKITPDLVLADSNYINSALQRIYPSLQIKTCYYPVSYNQLSDRVAIRQDIRNQLHTDLDKVVILQSSRLEPRKGHRLLIEALGQLTDLPNWECWIAGGVQQANEAEYLQTLHNQAQILGIRDRLQFLGQRSDVPQLLVSADIHCQPNIWEPEPFGIAFVEALYAGLPVVTTAMGGALEIVDPTCGILTPLDDPTELATALRSLITDPLKRATLGSNGYTRAQSLCDPAQQINQIHELLLTSLATI